MSAWRRLGNYTAAVGLLTLGLTGWQLAIGLSLGVVVIYLTSNMMGIAGQKIGVPFPVFARASFGVFGANIPALLRAVVAVAWYGIQTYLASVVVLILVVKLWPQAEALTHSDFLGLSSLGWICFLGMWLVQLGYFIAGWKPFENYPISRARPSGLACSPWPYGRSREGDGHWIGATMSARLRSAFGLVLAQYLRRRF